MEAPVYNQEGKELDKVTLPEGIFGLPWNADLVHQVAVSLASSKRKNVAHTKSRGEVRGGGKKPWKQKGTGRARHGSTRSPIWVGGGVTHGPRNEKNYDRKVSKKMKAKALFTILSKKYRDGEVVFVDSINIAKPKTADAIKTLNNISGVKGFERIFSKKKNAATIALSTKSKDIEKSFANLGNIEVLEVRNLHPLGLLEYKYLVIENPKASFDALPGQKLLKKSSDKPASTESKAKGPVKAKPKAKAKAVAKK
jgi:large subunit ribosomal protein L4